MPVGVFWHLITSITPHWPLFGGGVSGGYFVAMRRATGAQGSLQVPPTLAELSP